MTEKQYDLFEDIDAKKDMESVDEKSTGLSIIPYLAVTADKKQEKKSNMPAPSKSWKGLNAEQIHLLKNEEKYSYRKTVEDFEKRNGFPLAWLLAV